jgi:hypothetical protein
MAAHAGFEPTSDASEASVLPIRREGNMVLPEGVEPSLSEI